MNAKYIALAMTLALACGLSAANAAKKTPSLLPFAGSYTGTALSTTAAGTISGSSTLTFTGRKNNLRGTFLYNGILNYQGMPQATDQTMNVSKTGECFGRLRLGGVDGQAAGKVSLHGKKLSVTLTYTLYDTAGTTVNLTGTIVFKAKSAVWTATVSSPNAPDYNGSLRVSGKR